VKQTPANEELISQTDIEVDSSPEDFAGDLNLFTDEQMMRNLDKV
jgi:hypothetical protein